MDSPPGWPVAIFSVALLAASGCFSEPSPNEGAQSQGGTSEASTSTSGEPTPDPTSTTSTSTGSTTEPEAPQGTGTSSSSEGSSRGEASSSSEGSSGPGIVCGDGVVDGDEACDEDDLQGRTCGSFGFLSGELACSIDCRYAFMSCDAPSGKVYVPGGPFTMGSLEPGESPVRQVHLDGFFIGRHEVTAAEYQACLDEGDCEDPMSTANTQYDGQCNVGQPGREDHPANCVGHDAAALYCAWAGERLPTEAEWEKAARGTDERRYPWGEVPSPSGSCSHAITGFGGLGCGTGSTLEVGSVVLGVSPYGAHDMAGNVWEWVSDYYAPYEAAALDNPTGPASGNQRVLRGGGWYNADSAEFTTSVRHSTSLNLSDAFIGFRCVIAAPEPD